MFPKGRIVDLSHLLLPGQEQYRLEVSMRGERTGEEGDVMCDMYLWSHVGTHVEAPLHFFTHGKDISELPLETFIGPAIVLDFRHKGINEPMTIEDFKAAGHIQVGDRVITWTGRDNLYRTPRSHDRPYVSEEAARWLIEDREIKLLGTDSSGFEVRGVSHHPNHRLFYSNAVPVIECLANLEALTKQRVYLIALPWRVKGLDASPIRAIAIEPEDGS